MFRVIGIHGVGIHAAGSVRSMIARGVAESGARAEVEEIFWSDDVKIHSHKDAFLFGGVGRTSKAMLAMASDGLPYLQSSPLPAHQRLLQLIDTGAFAIFLAFFFLIPIAMALTLYDAWFESRTPGPAEFLTPTRTISTYVLVGALILSVVLFLTGIARRATDRRDQGAPFPCAIRVATRRIGLFLTNIIFVLIVWPLSSFWPRVFLGVILVFTFLGALIIAPAQAVARFILRLLNVPTEVIEREAADISSLDLLLIAGQAGMFIAALLIVFVVLYPLVKMLADISLYVGDISHRQSLLKKVDDTIEKLDTTDSHFLIVGHSLGSIIAIDYLRVNSSKLSNASSVTLVTMGSPIARLLHRYFPRTYNPPTEILRELKQILPNFYWLNIYRPFDPIGGALGIAEDACGSDKSTEQVFVGKLLCGRLFAQHEGYFDDHRVHEICRRLLVGRLSSMTIRKRESTSKPISLPPFGSSEDRQLIQAAAVFSWAIGIGLLAWLAFVHLPRSIVGVEVEAISAFRERAAVTTGRVEVGQIANLWLFGRPIWPDYLARVIFIPDGETKSVRTIPLDVDHEKAYSWAAEGRVTDFGLVNEAAREGVEIIYDRLDPTACFVPEFRAGRWTGRNGNWFNRAILFLLPAIVWTALIIFQTGMASYFFHSVKSEKKYVDYNPFA